MLSTVLEPLVVGPGKQSLPLLHPLLVQFLPRSVQLEGEVCRSLGLFLQLRVKDGRTVAAAFQLLQKMALFLLQVGSENSHQSPFLSELLPKLSQGALLFCQAVFNLQTASFQELLFLLQF